MTSVLPVINIPEDTQESDLSFPSCGKVGRYRDTGTSNGFAFVGFEDKTNAPKAINKMNGRCYDNLILDVQWSRKCLSIPELACSNLLSLDQLGALWYFS